MVGEKCIRSPETIVTEGLSPHVGAGQGPLEEQTVCLITESSLQSSHPQYDLITG